MITEVAPNTGIYQINLKILKLNSNCYFLGDEKTLIDSSSNRCRDDFLKELGKYAEPEDISKVFLTHMDWDHIGNMFLCENAEVYADRKEVVDFFEKRYLHLQKKLRNEIGKPRISLLDEKAAKSAGLDILRVPGHTQGSVAYYHAKSKILFSGDASLNHPNLKGIDAKIICSGHGEIKYL